MDIKTQQVFIKMLTFKEIFEAAKRNIYVFLVGVITGFLGFILFSTTFDLFYTSKEVTSNNVKKAEFKE